MTTLILDHTQRLQLVAMLDRVECQGRREAWAVCALQEKLDLTDEERDGIGYRKQQAPDGREMVFWNKNGHLPREYNLSEDEIKWLCNAVDKYRVVLIRDREWWVPLTAQLPKPEEPVGG